MADGCKTYKCNWYKQENFPYWSPVIILLYVKNNEPPDWKFLSKKETSSFFDRFSADRFLNPAVQT